ncbi:sensor histidine kinase [Luethyella okanaganae]|uniref:histidine kinase n=1 Tax=Luethyella okanaganae TaxID=69372 RepID=A0ABW1VEL2_9MICO
MKNTQNLARGNRLPVLGGVGAPGFNGLPRRGRVALLVLLGVILLVDVGLYLSDPETTWRSMLLGLSATFATALFAWWPAAAAMSLLLTGLVQTTAGQDGSQFLYLTAVAGLVVYTSPAWFIAIYVVVAAGLAILATATPGVFVSTALPALALVLAVSASIGWALRTAHGRERRFALDIAQLEYARTAAIDAERERIADELHDIIAHDVTLVSMHARVLERVDDPALRNQSIQAIRTSADQALADIRRVLRIVRDDHVTGVTAPDEQQASATSALEEARDSLARLGAEVTVHASSDISVSTAIEQALVHLMREGATNIAKHAPEHPSVTIVLESVDDEIHLELTNSTTETPHTPHVPSSGYGLDRLRERVSLLGGHLSTHTTGTTWTLTARLPAR